MIQLVIDRMKSVNPLVWGAMLAILFILGLPAILQKVTLSLSFPEDQTWNETDVQRAEKKLTSELSGLNRKLALKTPKSYYLIINTSANEFSLKKGRVPVHSDKCSTGSYVLLKNGDQQEWMFKTPKGEFRIKSKTISPVWKKPDWAFVEEGLPIPPPNHHSRFEYGVLGDYALNLGQGYLIHGTLYQRSLGLPVTHGCVRLDDKNLELVYNSLSEGSKVYIF